MWKNRLMLPTNHALIQRSGTHRRMVHGGTPGQFPTAWWRARPSFCPDTVVGGVSIGHVDGLRSGDEVRDPGSIVDGIWPRRRTSTAANFRRPDLDSDELLSIRVSIRVETNVFVEHVLDILRNGV